MGIFFGTVLATALLDSLLHHATTINIRGESYRCGTAARAVFPGSLSKERSHAGTLNRTAAGVSNSKPSQLSTSYPALTQCQPHPLG